MGEFTGIGPALRLLRKDKDVSQKELSVASKVSKTLISGYERSQTEPTLSSLNRLLEALSCDRFDLLNALEKVNGRPLREFPLARTTDRPPGCEIIDALGIRGLDGQQEDDFLRMLDGFRSWFEQSRALRRRMDL